MKHFLVLGLALAGIFPLSGFWSKDEILHAAHLWSISQVPFYLGLAAAFLTALYMMRQVVYVFFGKPRPSHHASTGTLGVSWITTMPPRRVIQSRASNITLPRRVVAPPKNNTMIVDMPSTNSTACMKTWKRIANVTGLRLGIAGVAMKELPI